MEVDYSPYLEAIQRVSGLTPGEKYQTLNCIARQIVATSHEKSDAIQIKLSSEVPGALIPLVKLEIDKITRQYTGIIEALKSEDKLLFHRALRMKCFFTSDNEIIMNIHLLQEQILNSISLKHRRKLLKILVKNLTVINKNFIDDELYDFLVDTCSMGAGTFLLACNESFIWETIIKRKLILSVKNLQKMYYLYPNLVIKYLELYESEYCNNDSRNVNCEFKKFVPRLLKRHMNYFMKYFDKWSLDKLSRNSMKIILKNGIQFFIEHAPKLGSLMDKKLIATKLTDDQFKSFFYNLFEKNPDGGPKDSFSFMKIYNYLEYYPCEDKLEMMLLTFEEVYKMSFFTRDEYVSSDAWKLFPLKTSVKKINEEVSENNRIIGWRESYRICDLPPINEAIAKMKNQMRSETNTERRLLIVEEMIRTCRVNHDGDALLEVLKYIETYHKNEDLDFLIPVMRKLKHYFRIEKLLIEHWKVLGNIIQIMYILNEFPRPYPSDIMELAIANINGNLIHNLPITEPIKIFFHTRRREIHKRDWNIMQHNPDFERKCLEEFINVASTSNSSEISSSLNTAFVSTILQAINDFNRRNFEIDNRIKKMTIEGFPWLKKEIRRSINEERFYGYFDILRNLRNINLDFFNTWVDEELKIEIENYLSNDHRELHLEWKENLDSISTEWEEYLNESMRTIQTKRAQKFIRDSKWYQDIPIKFAGKCNEYLVENQNSRALYVLALLLEGPAFERVIAPYLLINSTTETEKETKRHSPIMKTILNALRFVNPPTSLNVTPQSCSSRLNRVPRFRLQGISLRSAINKLSLFIKSFIDESSLVSKNSIEIFKIRTKLEQLYKHLIPSWTKQEYLTTRSRMLEVALNLSKQHNCDEMWMIVIKCIEGLTVGDKSCLSMKRLINEIPNLFILDYLERIFIKVHGFSNHTFGKDENIRHNDGLANLREDIISRYGEQFHQDVLQLCFYNEFISDRKMYDLRVKDYFINSYLSKAGENLESRLDYHAKIFSDYLKNHWNVCYDLSQTDFYQANYMVDMTMTNIDYEKLDFRTRLRFIDTTLKAFCSVLNPIQAPNFYCHYVFASCYYEYKMPFDKYAMKIYEVIPSLLTIFSHEFIDFLGPILEKSLKSMNKDHGSSCTIDVVESLLALDDENAALLALSIPIDTIDNRTYILPEDSKFQRYGKILTNVDTKNRPIIKAKVSMKINKFDLALEF